MLNLNNKEKALFSIIFIIMALIALFTHFYGDADTLDYSDSAKFFAGKYDAKIRTSHSYMYGLIHTPLVYFFESFLFFKVTSLISLFLIVLSVYLISGRDKKALWLISLSPIVWYMSPWMSPIQLASLIFIWGYYFINKYEKTNQKSFLFYSGLLIGLSWAFWDGILFFTPLLMISFLYNKKLFHSIYFLAFLAIGALPRLILDHILFGLPIFGAIRHIGGSLALTFIGGFYGQEPLSGILKFIFVIIFIPSYSYLMFRKDNFKKDHKTAIFILLSIILLIINSQIRFTLLIVPIIIISVSKLINKKQFVIQLAIFLIILLVVINPYLIQTKYETNGQEFSLFLRNIHKLELNEEFTRDKIEQDLKDITSEYPEEIFVVGNRPDSYQLLADIHWGQGVKEFVSIQDYFLQEDPTIAKQEACSNAPINNRRDICFSISIRKAFSDETDYSSINYGISEDGPLEIQGFELIEEYRQLSLYKKVNTLTE